MLPTNRPPTHPGQMLHEFINELNKEQSALASKAMTKLVPQSFVQDWTLSDCEKVANYFGMEVQFWMNLQVSYSNWMDDNE